MSRLPRAAGRVLAEAGAEAVVESARAAPAEKVHAVRVAAKRLRSYWRLLKPVVGAASARRRRRELARAARFLAAERERDVLGGLARRLARGQRRLARPLGAFLERLPAPPEPRLLERRLRAAVSRLDASQRELAAGARRASRRDLRKRLEKLERKLDRSRRRARRRGERADVHECRKRAKDLKYILDAFGARPAAAKRLSKAADELGDARDLRLLASRAGLAGSPLESRARELERSGLARLEPPGRQKSAKKS